MRMLSDEQFRATCRGRMGVVQADPAAAAALPRAVLTVPAADWCGFVFRGPMQDEVRRGKGGLFERYLVPTTTADVFVVRVWYLLAGEFIGWHLLNLHALYGRPTRPLT